MAFTVINTTDTLEQMRVKLNNLTQTDFDGKTKKYEIISIDNRLIVSELVRVTNILGQDINLDTPGLKLFHYTDGTIIKRY